MQQVFLYVPLQVEAHQLVHVKAETDIGDGAAGVGLAGGGRSHREPQSVTKVVLNHTTAVHKYP